MFTNVYRKQNKDSDQGRIEVELSERVGSPVYALYPLPLRRQTYICNQRHYIFAWQLIFYHNYLYTKKSERLLSARLT